MKKHAPSESGSQQVTGAHVGGSLVQVQHGDVIVQLGAAVPSAYLEQVKRIAPPELKDRDEELTELAAFCCDGDAGPYVWWRADPWTGKSALLSWFVLHPPPNVRIVSFFITARYAGQDDRMAFIDVALEQLADLLGQPIPTSLTDATREPHLLRMLADAAALCRQSGEHLALVVDGLDEDRGVTTGADSHSIAALLPERPSSGLKIIVAGRPNPPVPSDVPAAHPLRDPAIVRVLRRSRQAQVVQADMQRELKRLLQGTAGELDLLGFITAAGGGLSGPDLAALTGLPTYDVGEQLNAVAGRTFTSRPSRWVEGTVYVLGHEELQTASVTYLGTERLKDYRQRLHTWADGYRQQSWPPGTPEYLLRGYYRLLKATGDVSRMVACATDQKRHDRMLDMTGGDTAAITEIVDAQEAVLQDGLPDLVALARLALHRDTLIQRNARVPTRLPAVWAILDRPARAEALARGISDPYLRSQALATLTRALRRTSNAGWAARTAQQAELAVRSITTPDQRAQARATLARVLADAGSDDPTGEPNAAGGYDAKSAASPEGNKTGEIRPLIFRIRTAAVTGDVAQAMALYEQAKAEAEAISDPARRVQVLASIAEVLADAGLRAAAVAVAERAEAIARTITPTGPADHALTALASALAVAGDFAQAETIAHLVTHARSREHALAAVAETMASEPDQIERASAIASNCRPNQQAPVQAAVAKTLAAIGKLGQAEAAAHSINHAARRAQALAAVAAACADSGRLERAVAIASTVGTSDLRAQAQALTAVAKALAALGEWDRAEATAYAIAHPGRQAQALAALSLMTGASGNRQRARELTQQADAAVQAITDANRQASALARLALVFAAGAEPATSRKYARQAEATAVSIADPILRALALASVSKAVAESKNPEWVPRLIQNAEIIAHQVADSGRRTQGLVALVRALAAAGAIEKAADTVRAITDATRQAQVLAALARDTQPDCAHALIARALTMGHWSAAIADLACVHPAAVKTLADEITRQ
jgi:hypothetical protein